MNLSDKFKAFANKEISKLTFSKAEIELAALTINPTGQGGRLDITPAKSPLRQPNPFRLTCEQSTTGGSEVGWVQKTGNALVGATNPWGAVVQPNAGSPNIDTAYWKLPIQDVNTYISVRNLIIDDITDLLAAGLILDLRRELEQIAATSMVLNNNLGTLITATAVGNPVTQAALNGFTVDFTVTSSTGFNVNDFVQVAGNTNTAINGVYKVQATSATVIQVFYPANPGNPTGGTTTLQDDVFTNANGGSNGLRGLNSYADGSASAFGTSGPLPNNGIHTIATQTTAAAGVIAYNDLTAMRALVPAQFLQNPDCKWHMHPSTIQKLRELKDSQNFPLFLEVGDDDGGACLYIFGHQVIPNSYIQTIASGNYAIYFGDWQQGFEIVDANDSMTIMQIEQFSPGSTQIFGQLRLASSVTNPFALARLKIQ